MCIRDRNGLDGIVWFQREIEIPSSWEGKEITLNLGMIDDEDVTYYNGKEIAKGYGYSTPRHYTVPAELVKAGKGVITIRAVSYTHLAVRRITACKVSLYLVDW